MANNDTTTEYIPTDDRMRSVFCQSYAQGDFDKHDQAWDAWEKWLAAHDARVKAEAWDEGWGHAVKVYRASGTGPRTRNPYEL